MSQINIDLSCHAGLGVFGKAYRAMLERDPHAPGSVDRVLVEKMVRLCQETADLLYSGFTPTTVQCIPGTRPVLERLVSSVVGQAAGAEEKVSALSGLTAGLREKVAGQTLEDMRVGGTEEQILKCGSDWCTDVARVGCALFQVAGFPSRLVYLADTQKAYSGHAIVEVFRQGVWGGVDTGTGVIYRREENCPASVWELMKNPKLVDRHRTPLAGYSSPNQFRAAAVSNYFIREAAKFNYAVSGLNDYYRSILGMSGSGWPGGLRWLHGEEARYWRGDQEEDDLK